MYVYVYTYTSPSGKLPPILQCSNDHGEAFPEFLQAELLALSILPVWKWPSGAGVNSVCAFLSATSSAPSILIIIIFLLAVEVLLVIFQLY